MQHRGNALNVLLLAAVVVCALSVVSSQHKARKLFIELQKEKEHARLMEVEWGQLQLEQSTLAAPARVERIAAQQLQMQFPQSGQVRFIRVEPPSDGTTSHSTKPASGQVAGYPQSSPVYGESEARGAKPNDHPISLREKVSENFNGHTNKQP